MKNIIIIDLDTEREQKLIYGKPEEIKQLENVEEAKQMVKTDMFTLCQAISTLINVAHQNKYLDSKEALAECIINLENNINDKQ